MKTSSPIKISKARDSTSIIEIYYKKEKNYFLSSQYAPIKEAKRIIENAPIKETKEVQFVFCLGGGNLALCFEILKTYKQAQCLIIENHPSISKEIQKHLSQASNCFLLNEETYLQKTKELFESFPSKQILFFYNQIQLKLFPEFYTKAQKKIKEAHEKKAINIATLSRFERLWLRNITQNTQKIIHALPCTKLTNKGKNYPIIVIGAGPSLSFDLNLIKKHQQNFIIIALDTIYKTLLNHKISPDILIVVDPQKINSKYIENTKKEKKNDLIVVSEPAVCPKGIREFENIFMFDTIFPYYNYITAFFGKKGSVDMGGSVSTTAYEILQLLSCKAATFTGLDLCYTKDAYHIPGTMYEDYWFSTIDYKETFEMKTFKLLNYFNLVKTKTIDNKIGYVDAKFTLFKNWFEKKLIDNQLKLFNSSKSSVSIKGLSYLPFSDFIKQYAKNPINKKIFLKELIKNNQPFIDETNKKNFLLSLQEVKKNISSYKKNVHQANQLCVKILKKINKKEHYYKEKEKLDKIDQLLQKNFFEKKFINVAVQDIINKVKGEKEIKTKKTFSKEEEIYEISKMLYSEIIEACKLNVKYFEKVSKSFI